MKDRIALKIVMMLVFFSLVLTIFMTFAQLRSDYLNEEESIRAAMDVAVSRHRLELSGYLESGAIEALDRVLYHLINDTAIDYASIAVENRVLSEHGTNNTDKDITLTYSLNAEDGPDSRAGVFVVAADLDPVRNKLRQRFFKILNHNAVFIFLTAAFVFLMFQALVTRHLEKLAAQVANLDPTKPYLPIRIERIKPGVNDELTQVVNGVNVMLKKARDTYESLVKNEEKLHLFFDSTQEAIIGFDSSGVCTFANEACRKLLEIKGDEQIAGKNSEQLFWYSSKKYGQSGATIAGLTMEKAEALHSEDGLIVLPGGKKIHVSLKSYPVLQENEVSGAVVFMVDNSMTRQLRQESDLLNTALGQIPVMIVITDIENRIQYVNPGTERLLGFTRQDMMGKPLGELYELLGAENSKKFVEIEDSIREGKPWSGIVEVQSKFNNSLQFYTMFFPVYDDEGRLVSTISASREVTYELKLQNELINAKKMEAVVRLSSNLAHEFGNPLFGVSAVLKDFKDREDHNARDAELLNLAYSECERLRRLVREFQNLYKGSSQDIEYQSVAHIIKTVLLEATPVMHAYNISYELGSINAATTMVVSGSKLAMVLNNVVINGIESMVATGGKLAVSVTADKGFLTITVSDTGIGVKQEYQELIFEPFFSTKPVVEGAGLGLSIAYGTMKSLGGSISFESTEHKGSSFHIHIPMNS